MRIRILRRMERFEKTLVTGVLKQRNMGKLLVSVGVLVEVAIVNLLRYSLSHCVTFFRSILLTWPRTGESKYLVSSILGVYLDGYNEKTDG